MSEMKSLLANALRKAAGLALGLGLSASLLAGCAQTGATGAPTTAAAATPTAGAPMWVVRDADSTIYLFGTVHALRPETQWRTPAVDAALASSSELWLEIEEPDNPAALQPLIMQLGMSPQTPLSSRLTPAERTLLASAAQRAGLPPQALEPMRPWLAGLTLAVAPLLQAGYDPTKGVDTLLKAAAAQRNIPIRAFETPEQQFRFFADLPDEQQMAFLRAALEDFSEGPAVIDRLSGAWAAGDVATLERIMVDEMRQESPQLYRVVLADRNERWAERIQQMLAGSGTTFIAVGAGHLVGPDSVQARLQARGIRSERR